MPKSDITRARWVRAIIALSNPRDWTKRWELRMWLVLGLVLGNIIAFAIIFFPTMMSRFRMSHDPAYKREKMTQNLAGIYYADNQWSREKMTLKEDGTCLQEVNFNMGRGSQTAPGTWAYCPDQKLEKVCLYGNFIEPSQSQPKAERQVQVSPGGSTAPPVKVFAIRYQYGCTHLDLPDEFHYDRCELSKIHP